MSVDEDHAMYGEKRTFNSISLSFEKRVRLWNEGKDFSEFRLKVGNIDEFVGYFNQLLKQSPKKHEITECKNSYLVDFYDEKDIISNMALVLSPDSSLDSLAFIPTENHPDLEEGTFFDLEWVPYLGTYVSLSKGGENIFTDFYKKELFHENGGAPRSSNAARLLSEKVKEVPLHEESRTYMYEVTVIENVGDKIISDIKYVKL